MGNEGEKMEWYESNHVRQEAPGSAEALIVSFYTPYFKNRIDTDAQNVT